MDIVILTGAGISKESGLDTFRDEGGIWSQVSLEEVATLDAFKKNPEKMPSIFFRMFKGSSINVIKFLSNKSNFFEDLSIILKMPKWIFIKALFRS